MKLSRIACLFVASLGLVASATAAQESGQIAAPAVPPGFQYQAPMAYPAANQGAEQQTTDVAECHTFASQNNLGFDPRNPQATLPTSEQITQQAQQEQEHCGPDGSAVRRAARGAASGALIGWATGNAGRGAAIGAASGAILGRAGSRRAKRAQAQQEQEAAAAAQQAQYDNFTELVERHNAGFMLCMDARGYAVQD